MNVPDVSNSKLSGSVSAYHGGIYWFGIPSFPRHSYALAGRSLPSNTSEVFLDGDYAVGSYYNDGR